MVSIKNIIDWAKDNNLKYLSNISEEHFIEGPWNIGESTSKNISFIK